MDDFAKLFRNEEVGQVLVMLDTGDEGPEVQFHLKPKGLGVCVIKLGFPDTDGGWECAEEAFASVDQEKAFTIARDALAGPMSCFSSQLTEGD